MRCNEREVVLTAVRTTFRAIKKLITAQRNSVKLVSRMVEFLCDVPLNQGEKFEWYSVEALEYFCAHFLGTWVIDMISMINYQWSLDWWKILFQNQVVNTNGYSILDWDFQSKTESFQFHNHKSWKAMGIAMQSVKFGCPIYSDVHYVHGKWYQLN